MLYDHLSGGQYERLMATFSRSSSHAVELSRAIATTLRLGLLSKELERADLDTARVVDLGSGPGVALGLVLKAGGLAREVFTHANSGAPARWPALGQKPEKAPPRVADRVRPSLSVWCVDPFYCRDARESASSAAAATDGDAGGGPEHAATLPTDEHGCRLQVTGGGRVHFGSADAIQFMRGCRERVGLVDRILMKEMIHHVDNYRELGRYLRESLRPGTGMALITGRTPSEDIPWFPQVRSPKGCISMQQRCVITTSAGASETRA